MSLGFCGDLGRAIFWTLQRAGFWNFRKIDFAYGTGLARLCTFAKRLGSFMKPC
jgi:hypothetical protein